MKLQEFAWQEDWKKSLTFIRKKTEWMFVNSRCELQMGVVKIMQIQKLKCLGSFITDDVKMCHRNPNTYWNSDKRLSKMYWI